MTVVTGDAKNIEKLLTTMYGNDWKDFYKVKGDDYGMMKEVLFRRFSKAIKEKSGSLSLPDLVMIDGGKGQYSVSREVLTELGLHDLPILAIAKGKKRNAS